MERLENPAALKQTLSVSHTLPYAQATYLHVYQLKIHAHLNFFVLTKFRTKENK